MPLIINKEEYVNKTFRLEKTLVDKMYIICHEKNISMNKFIDIALRYAIDNLDEKNEDLNKGEVN